MSWLDLFIFFNFSFSQFWDEKEGPKSGSKSIGPISLFPSLLPLLYVSTFKAQIYKAYIKHKITQPQTQVQFHMLLFQKIFPFIFKKKQGLGEPSLTPRRPLCRTSIWMRTEPWRCPWCQTPRPSCDMVLTQSSTARSDSKYCTRSKPTEEQAQLHLPVNLFQKTASLHPSG